MNEQNEKLWVSVSRASQLLGIPTEEINAHIQNGRIPFHKNGTRYTLNWKLVAAVIARMDIENMNRSQKAIAANPLSRRKVTGDISNYQRKTPIREQK